MRARRWVGMVAVACLALATPVGAQTGAPAPPFTLVAGVMTVSPNAPLMYQSLKTLFGVMELEVSRNGAVGGGDTIALTGQDATTSYSGSQRSFVLGSYDTDKGRLSGTFQISQHVVGTRVTNVSHEERTSEWTLSWNGKVAGTVGSSQASLTFAGSAAVECRAQADSGAWDDCSTTQQLSYPVTFTVGQDTQLPGATGRTHARVSGVSGPVYVSSGEEADLEPAQRTWHPVETGDRILLNEASMIRTGPGATVKITRSDHTVVRLGESSLVTVYPPDQGPKVEMGQVFEGLLEGVGEFYFPKDWDPEFGVRSRFVYVGIKGTTFGLASSAASDEITAVRHRVEVHHLVSGESVVLQPGEAVAASATGLEPVRSG